MAEDAPRTWRCFWAVPLPDELRVQLAEYVARLRLPPGTDEAWRFTDAAGWHVTLAFLGATASASVEPMTGRVAEAARPVSPFTVAAGGLGGFPRGSPARVLWYGIQDDDGRLARLADLVRQAAGVHDEAPFRPHVTLARARDRRGANIPAGVGEPPIGEVPVREVILFRSHQGRGPASYEALTSISLRMPSALQSRS